MNHVRGKINIRVEQHIRNDKRFLMQKYLLEINLPALDMQYIYQRRYHITLGVCSGVHNYTSIRSELDTQRIYWNKTIPRSIRYHFTLGISPNVFCFQPRNQHYSPIKRCIQIRNKISIMLHCNVHSNLENCWAILICMVGLYLWPLKNITCTPRPRVADYRPRSITSKEW